MKNKDNTEVFKLPISKVGRFTPRSGIPVDITNEMLTEMAESYDPELRAAPFVLGHPKVDDPAFGHGTKMFVENDTLYIEGEKDNVAPEFRQLITDKKYKEVSLAWFDRNAPNNPVPGKLYPKHIGALGAIPGAVPLESGLETLSFSEAEQTEGVIECSWAMESLVPGLFSKIRDWMIEKFGRDEADNTIPDWMIESIKESEGNEKLAEAEAFSEGDTSGDAPENENPTTEPSSEGELNNQDNGVTMTEAEIQALKDENDALKTTVSQFKSQAQKAEQEGINAFCESLVNDKKMMPEVSRKLNQVLTSLNESDGVVEFSEGESVDQVQAVQDIITEALDYKMEFSEKGADDADDVKAFSAPPGTTVDRESATMLAKAKQIVADSGGKLTLRQAVAQVEK